jgi:hypothetical protein
MPRSNREYLLRYCEQAMNDLQRSLERLKMLSDAYGGVYKPLEGDLPVELTDETAGYEGAHGNYQAYVDIQAALVINVLDNLELFRKQYM